MAQEIECPFCGSSMEEMDEPPVGDVETAFRCGGCGFIALCSP